MATSRSDAVRGPCPDAARGQPRQPQGGLQGALRGRLAGRRDRVTERAGVRQLDLQAALRARGRQRLGHAGGEDGQRDIGTRGVGAFAVGEQQLQDPERLTARAQYDREHGTGAGAARQGGRAVAAGHDGVVVPQSLERQGVQWALSHRIGESRPEACQHLQAVLLHRVQQRAVGAAGAARQARGHARDGGAVVRGRECLARDVEQLRQTRLHATAGAREGQRRLCRDMPQQLPLGLAERIGPGAQDLEDAHRAARPADRQRQRGGGPAALQAARDGRLERCVDIGLAPAHCLLEATVERCARAGQLGFERRRVDVHGARDQHAARGVEDAHEHGVGAGELRRHAREQRQRAGIVAFARGGCRLVERGQLCREAACADRGVRGLERAARDLRDAVGEREILGRERLAGIPAAEDDGDTRTIGVAQREREHCRRPAVALERDVGRIARDRGALARERARGEAAVGTQMPALHPAGPASRAGRDHEPPVGLAHGDRGPVAGKALGRGTADRIEHAIQVERHAGQQTGRRAHAIGDRGTSPQRGSMRRVELGGGRRADPLEYAARGSEHGLRGLEGRARDLRSQLDEGPLDGTHERDEAEAALDAARDLALEHERRERRAMRVAQRALQRLQCLLAPRANARERHALGCEHLVRGQ